MCEHDSDDKRFLSWRIVKIGGEPCEARTYRCVGCGADLVEAVL